MQSDPAWAQAPDLPRTDFADAKLTSPTQTDEASTRLRSHLTPEPSTNTRNGECVNTPNGTRQTVARGPSGTLSL